MDLTNAKAILATTAWSDIFPSDKAAAKRLYLSLCKKWHPDANKDPLANDVFTHMAALFKEVGNPLPDTISAKGFSFSYIYKDTFEMGEVFFNKKSVVFAYDKEFASAAEKGLKNLSTLLSSIAAKHLDDKNLGAIVAPSATYTDTQGRKLVVFDRPENTYRLFDILRLGPLDPRHTAWIISRLCNISCLLGACGFTGNNIALANCFLDVANHRVVLLGGWEYSGQVGEKFISVNAEVFSYLSAQTKKDKTMTTRGDLECIRGMARSLIQGQFPPMAFREWAWEDPKLDPVEEFRLWDKAIADAYGPRKFIKLEIKENDIFKKGGPS